MSDLEDLRKYKAEHGNIIEGLTAKIAQHLQENVIDNLDQKFVQTKYFDNETQLLDERVTSIFNNTSNIERTVSNLKNHLNSRLEMFATLDQLRGEIFKMTPLGDYLKLKEEIKTYAKSEDVGRTFTAFKNSLEKQNSQISSTLVQKGELAKTILLQKKWSQEQFVLKENMDKKVGVLDSKLKELQHIFDTYRKELEHKAQEMRELAGEMKGLAHQRDVEKLWAETKRFACYEDYKELYKKVVPPTVMATDNCKQMSKEIAQFREILARLDKNMGERALKSEINAYATELRTKCKKDLFLNFKNS